MVKCEICKKKFKLITQIHLKKHNTTLAKYKKKYPKAKIRDNILCINCNKVIENPQSARTKYCKACALKINQQNVTKNVRKFIDKKKKQKIKWYSEANREYGITIDNQDDIYRDVRIDFTHSQWDFIPNLQNNLGTITESSLNEKNGRIIGAVKLEREIKKLRDKQKRT